MAELPLPPEAVDIKTQTGDLKGLREFVANGSDVLKTPEAYTNAIKLLKHYFGNNAGAIRLRINMGGDLKKLGTKTEVGELLYMLGWPTAAETADTAFDCTNNLSSKERLEGLNVVQNFIDKIS
ncbi:MAG: hypothetical protein PHO48_02785 [Candidatus Gracilibacteria bacterium]|nr:hypothetical protein [Candidatus Gracilibacteria bacterium]MDD5179107.1 hypothetical protein [Candidatus Gracilibacteria bacterium]